MAESHELRNARLAEALKSWVADDGDPIDRSRRSGYALLLAFMLALYIVSPIYVKQESKQWMFVVVFFLLKRNLESLVRCLGYLLACTDGQIAKKL